MFVLKYVCCYSSGESAHLIPEKAQSWVLPYRDNGSCNLQVFHRIVKSLNAKNNPNCSILVLD